jgi:hypothetical protein
VLTRIGLLDSLDNVVFLETDLVLSNQNKNYQSKLAVPTETRK